MDRTGVLSGTIFDVFAEGDRTFWIATSEGVARYTPALWRPPSGLEDLDTAIHAAAEDAAGRLWFAATQWLLELDGAVWRRHPLPPGDSTDTVQTSSVIALADGRVLIKAVRADRSDVALIFDPRTRRFAELVHPGGRRITMIDPRAMAGARQTRLDAGMDHHIAKPVKLEDLVDALQKWLPEKTFDHHRGSRALLPV